MGVEMIRVEFKTTMINTLRALMEKVDGMQEETDKEDREARILKERTQKIYERSKTLNKKVECYG